MKQTKFSKLSFFLIVGLFSFHCSYSQSDIIATVSQYGSVYFRVMVGGDYIDISQEGRVAGYGGFVNGNITYDFKGRADRIGATSVSYDLRDRIESVGAVSVSYDLKGRVDKAGYYTINYDLRGRLDRIGDINVAYDLKGRIEKIKDAGIAYDFNGRVSKIDDNRGVVVFRIGVAGY